MIHVDVLRNEMTMLPEAQVHGQKYEQIIRSNLPSYLSQPPENSKPFSEKHSIINYVVIEFNLEGKKQLEWMVESIRIA